MFIQVAVGSGGMRGNKVLVEKGGQTHVGVFAVLLIVLVNFPELRPVVQMKHSGNKTCHEQTQQEFSEQGFFGTKVFHG